MFVVNVEGAIERNGRYLMIVRGPGESHAPGALSFPGGKVEPTDEAENELESTLRREISEEVGVECAFPVPHQVRNAIRRQRGGPVSPLDDSGTDPSRSASVV